jgi:predicted nuclease of predicted toxin-antitoxin system
MRVLFDQGTPVPLRSFLTGHTVHTAAQQRWATLENGELLDAAEAAGFDVLVTTDKNMRFQQNLAGRRIAIVVLGRPQWPAIQLHVEQVIAAVNGATPSSYTEVDIPA